MASGPRGAGASPSLPPAARSSHLVGGYVTQADGRRRRPLYEASGISLTSLHMQAVTAAQSTVKSPAPEMVCQHAAVGGPLLAHSQSVSPRPLPGDEKCAVSTPAEEERWGTSLWHFEIDAGDAVREVMGWDLVNKMPRITRPRPREL